MKKSPGSIGGNQLRGTPHHLSNQDPNQSQLSFAGIKPYQENPFNQMHYQEDSADVSRGWRKVELEQIRDQHQNEMMNSDEDCEIDDSLDNSPVVEDHRALDGRGHQHDSYVGYVS